MIPATEVERSGLDYLATVTELLDRIRTEHPTWGLFEAAEVQWWWAEVQRSTDDLGQLFWLDDEGRPVAAAIATRFGESTQLDPLVLPDASADWVAHVMHRGLEHVASNGYDDAILEVDRADDVLRTVLLERGFAIKEDGLVESWLAPDDRPPVSSCPDGYQLRDRAEAPDRPHHMVGERRGHVDPEPRLKQTSLYRPDLDLGVYDANGDVAGYGLFWHNAATGVGVVEPMRTEDDHQQRGIARHILTSGIDRLAQAGATRIKVAFEPGNPAAKRLYLGCGFEPHRENDLFAGSTSA